MTASAPRTALWSGIEAPRHLALIDDALDKNDFAHLEMVEGWRKDLTEVRADMKAGFAKCEEASTAQRRLLVGLLLSIVASSFAIVFTVAAFGAPT